MRNASAVDRFRYWFDGVMSKGTVALVGLLALITLALAARRKGETAIGYRVAAEAADGERRYGVRVSPPKQDVLRFRDGDTIIVLADA